MPVIRQQRQIFNKPIGVQSFNTGAEQVGLAVSNFANNVGQIAYKEAAKKAEESGVEQAQSAVLLDAETGKPTLPQSPDGMGRIARRAYERVIDRRFVDALDKDVRIKSQEMASKYKDPVQYENMFGNYLTSLSQGADAKFSNVVMESGKYIMASTKISLVDAARSRARAAASADVARVNSEYEESVYDMASAGNVEAALAMVNERGVASQEATDAGLYKAGYSAKVTSGLAATAISGTLETILPTATPTQQAGINLYIGTQGKSGGEFISLEQKAKLEPLVGYVNRSNTRSILQSSDAMMSDFNALNAARAQEAQAIAATQARAMQVGFGSTNEANQSYATQSIQSAWATGDLAEISGVIDFLDTSTSNRINELKGLRRNDSISQEAYNSMHEAERRSALEPVVFAIARDGNIDALKAAVVSGNPSDVALLTGPQQQALQSLQGSGIYNATLDRDHVLKLLRGSENEVRSRVETELRVAGLIAETSNISTDFLDGSFDDEALRKAVGGVQAALNSGDINAEKSASLISGIQSSAAKGIANVASSSLNSAQMVALTNYVKSGGSETFGATPYVTSVGDAILETIPEGKVSDVSNHINSVREKLEKKESVIEQAQEKEQVVRLIAGGGGDPSSKKHQSVSQEIADRLGIDVTSAESKTDQFYALARSAPPTKLIEGLSRLASGLPSNGGDVLLDHYAVLSNEVTDMGVFVNRLGFGEGGALTAKTTGILQKVLEIRSVEGGSASEIAQELMNLSSDPKSDLAVKKALGDVSVRQYLIEEYGEVIASDLDSVADFYLRTGDDLSEMSSKIEGIVDKTYLKSDNVIDPRFPIGSQNRSQFALERVFDDEEREAFISVIDEQLPEGYSVSPPVMGAKNLWSSAFNDGNKRAYLVPNENAETGTYYVYYVDEVNELRPLIYEKDGESFLPMFSKSDLKDFYAGRSQERMDEIESRLDRKEQMLNALRKRPGIRR
jgi:hypothetical protein